LGGFEAGLGGRYLVVDLACVCGGGACAGGGAGVVAGVADVATVLAAATAREELGGKTGAGVVLWAGGLQ